MDAMHRGLRAFSTLSNQLHSEKEEPNNENENRRNGEVETKKKMARKVSIVMGQSQNRWWVSTILTLKSSP